MSKFVSLRHIVAGNQLCTCVLLLHFEFAVFVFALVGVVKVSDTLRLLFYPLVSRDHRIVSIERKRYFT
jgi:hypothetical protein